ncbi:MAG: hypothetical protein J6P61_01460 [Erysipelotrichaceae bacterium]|nr:hypothetical protein [Erysipelotrichaceae bacterium]
MRKDDRQLVLYMVIPPIVILLQSRLISLLNSLIMTTTGEMNVFSLLKIIIYIITGLLMAYVARIHTRKRGLQIVLTIVHLVIFLFLILQYYSPILPYFVIAFLHSNELFIYLWCGVYISNLLTLLFSSVTQSTTRRKKTRSRR